MLLDDPLAMYLDEGGKINPGFRLRNPVVQEVPQPDIGVPDIPLNATTEDIPSRNRDRFQQAPNQNAGERDSVREDFERTQSDPISGTMTNTTNMNMLLNDPINGVQDMNDYLYDPIWGSASNATGGYGGSLTMYEDIPDLDVGNAPSFGNMDYIGA